MPETRASTNPRGEGAGPVRLDASGSGFERGGKAFAPFGLNYYDPRTGWPPRLWKEFDPARVERHLEVAAGLGVNAIRVFLTAASFFPDGERLDREALAKFDRLLEIADRFGILVHPTGPDHWEGNPPWRRSDLFADPEALQAQAHFWRLFAERFRGDSRIFAFDLLNEPHVSWGGPAMEAAWRRWAAARGAAPEGATVPPDAADPGSRRIAEHQAFRESLGERWVRVQVEAIRAGGSEHLVTVGLIQWSVPVLLARPGVYAALRPSKVVKYLDFLSIHFYPLDGDPLAGPEEFDRNLAYLEFALRCVRAADPRKPVLVGEFGWYGGGSPRGKEERSAEEQVRWCRAAVLQGRGLAAGWLNWAYADTPASTDISRFSGLVAEDDAVKPWGEAFREFARDPESWRSAPAKPSGEPFAFRFDDAVADPASGTRQLRAYFERWKRERALELEVLEAP